MRIEPVEKDRPPARVRRIWAFLSERGPSGTPADQG
jgi:hypothetical protein